VGCLVGLHVVPGDIDAGSHGTTVGIPVGEIVGTNVCCTCVGGFVL
jgi:hypothetical protein